MDFRQVVVIKCALILLISVVVSNIISKFIIKKAKKESLYQAIRDDIVSTHQLKNKTPTMGGIGMISATLLSLSLISPSSFLLRDVQAVILVMVSYFVIGLIDDYRKVHYHDSKGMPASIRFLLELLIAFLILIFLGYSDSTTWYFHLAFPKIIIDIGVLFIFLFPLMIVGSGNAVNLSDGLDGLATLLMIIALMPFVTIALVREQYDVSFLLCALFGALVGFAPLNLHPAKIFMGDCGSLMLGGVLAAIAIVLKAEGSLIVVGALFVIETLSVIIQVAYFKMTHKRVFLMAPLHHHFEMKGVAEWKVVMVFTLLALVLSFVALMIGVGL